MVSIRKLRLFICLLCTKSFTSGTTIIAKSSWNAAENGYECTFVIPSKALLVNHPVNGNDSPLPPEQYWILKIRHWVGGIVTQCQVIEPISRDKSTLYGGEGRQRIKKYRNCAIRSNSFGNHCITRSFSLVLSKLLALILCKER